MPDESETSLVHSSRLKVWKDIAPHLKQWLVALMFPTVSIILMYTLTSSECPISGYLGPGGLYAGGSMQNCTGGASFIVDKFLFSNHLDNNPSCQLMYGTGQFDRYGMLGSLNAVLLCFFGVQFGRTWLTFEKPSDKISRFLANSVFWGAIGILLCAAHKEIGWIPINSNLFSLSYVLICASLCYFCLAWLLTLTDIFQVWSGAPFVHLGSNSLLLYVCYHVLANYFPFSFADKNSEFFTNPSHESLIIQNSISVFCWWLLSCYLYRNNFFFVI